MSRAPGRLGWDLNSDSDRSFFAYHAAGGVTVNAVDTDMPLDTEVVESPMFTHAAGSAEVTINQTGYYNIDYNAGFSLNEDDIVEIRIQRDTGGGYADIPGSSASCGA